VYLKAPGQKFPILDNLFFVIRIDTFKVEYISVNTGNIESYTIPKILYAYGQPDEVYVWSSGWNNLEIYDVSLYLYYQNLGLLSKHHTTVSKLDVSNKKVNVCHQDYTQLTLWPQNQKLELYDLSKLQISDVSSFTLGGFKPLEQVSDLNVTGFYQSFMEAGEQPCVEIRVDSWFR
jgi:hypothetical protein